MGRVFVSIAVLVALGVVLALGLAELPASGEARSELASSLNARTVPERHATDAVGAVTYDYRAVDTLGEESILFGSVIGAVTLLRRQKDERDETENGEGDRAKGRRVGRPSDAVRALGTAVVLAMITVGGYLTTHGQVSPGGGFQGGAVLASAPLVVFLAADVRTFCRIAPEALVTVAEAAGMIAYLAVGAAGVVTLHPFLTNVLPLGRSGDVLSAGTIFALSGTVGLAVAGGVVLLAIDFLRDALERRLAGGSP